MKSDQPKISILLPSLNQARYLEASIRSAVSQNYANKEIILIDGGSKDGSVEIIKKYESELAYWVSEPDRCHSHALNKAMSHVTGDIIGWLNSDDCYLPGALRHVARAFQDNPDAVLVHGDRIMIDRDGHVAGWTALPPFDPATSGYVICSETAFWRKSACTDLHFDENLRFAMDVDFFCRLYHRGRFIKLNRHLGAFRCHAESKSSTIREVGDVEGKALWREIFPDLPQGCDNDPPNSKLKSLMALIQNPFTIALPYLYRRFFLGLRGMQTLDH